MLRIGASKLLIHPPIYAPQRESVSLCFFAYTARDHLQFNHTRSGLLVRLHAGTREPPSPQSGWIISSSEVPVESNVIDERIGVEGIQTRSL